MLPPSTFAIVGERGASITPPQRQARRKTPVDVTFQRAFSLSGVRSQWFQTSKRRIQMKTTASQVVRALLLALLVAGFAFAFVSRGIEEIHTDNSRRFDAIHLDTFPRVDSERAGEHMGQIDHDSLGAFDLNNSANDVSVHQKPIDDDISNCDTHNSGNCPNPAAKSMEPMLPDGCTGILALKDTQTAALGTN
jgi:hypothetical protein